MSFPYLFIYTVTLWVLFILYLFQASKEGQDWQTEVYWLREEPSQQPFKRSWSCCHMRPAFYPHNNDGTKKKMQSGPDGVVASVVRTCSHRRPDVFYEEKMTNSIYYRWMIKIGFAEISHHSVAKLQWNQWLILFFILRRRYVFISIVSPIIDPCLRIALRFLSK